MSWYVQICCIYRFSGKLKQGFIVQLNLHKLGSVVDGFEKILRDNIGKDVGGKSE